MDSYINEALIAMVPIFQCQAYFRRAQGKAEDSFLRRIWHAGVGAGRFISTLYLSRGCCKGETVAAYRESHLNN